MNLQLFDNIFSHFKAEKNLIEANIYQDDNSYTVEFYLAGIDKKDILLTYENDLLTIDIKNHEDPTLEVVKKEFYGYHESRSIPLCNADFSQCKTNYHNGKLVINIIKKCCNKVTNEIIID